VAVVRSEPTTRTQRDLAGCSSWSDDDEALELEKKPMRCLLAGGTGQEGRRGGKAVDGSHKVQPSREGRSLR
jgi:hypothetical protein